MTQAEILLQQAESLGAQLQQARASAADALALLVGAPPDLAGTPLVLDDGAVAPSLAPGRGRLFRSTRPRRSFRHAEPTWNVSWPWRQVFAISVTDASSRTPARSSSR